MKVITKSLVIFMAGLIVLTILFRIGLSHLLEHERFTSVWVLSGLYALLITALGLFTGKKDYESLPLYDIGFRFHVADYFICNLIGEAWYFFGLQSQYESVMIIRLIEIFWGIGLIIHFIFYLITRKNAINGIKKSEIFE